MNRTSTIAALFLLVGLAVHGAPSNVVLLVHIGGDMDNGEAEDAKAFLEHELRGLDDVVMSSRPEDADWFLYVALMEIRSRDGTHVGYAGTITIHSRNLLWLNSIAKMAAAASLGTKEEAVWQILKWLFEPTNAGMSFDTDLRIVCKDLIDQFREERDYYR